MTAGDSYLTSLLPLKLPRDIVCLIEIYCGQETDSEVPHASQAQNPRWETCIRASRGKWRRFHSLDEDRELPPGNAAWYSRSWQNRADHLESDFESFKV